MARHFFDARNEFHTVIDLQGCEISQVEEFGPAVLDAVRAIRSFLGDALASGAWDLEIRLGEDECLAVVGFDEVEAFEVAAGGDGVASRPG